MATEDGIGKYIQYDAGPLAGRCVRSELQEHQKADLGRKFAKRDRRPLDPPPIVRLRMFELHGAGLPSQYELEIPVEDVDISGLVAHVDLFAVEPPPSSSELSRYSPPSSCSKSPMNNGNGHLIIPPQHSSSCHRLVEDGSTPPNTISGCTSAIFGSSFVHGIQLDWQGQPMVFFVFSDLSVRFEGPFCIRYRCFDLFSRTACSGDIPIAAELYSGTFVIYSTKKFPGLQASTALTKHLTHWGVHANMRSNDRRKQTEDSSEDELVQAPNDGGVGPAKLMELQSGLPGGPKMTEPFI